MLDFLDEGADAAVRGWLGGPADVVLSDMAAPASGHPPTDHLRITALVEAAADFAMEVLEPGGTFVAKVLAGGAEAALVGRLNRAFAKVAHVKPPASRKDSSEKYLVATGFRGRRRARASACPRASRRPARQTERSRRAARSGRWRPRRR